MDNTKKIQQLWSHLGKTVEDKVTGFKGRIISLDITICGRVQFCVSPPCYNDDGTDSKWFPAKRLRIVNHGICMESADIGKVDTGEM